MIITRATEPFTLDLGEQTLPPSKSPGPPPGLNLGESHTWRARCQVQVKIARELVGSTVRPEQLRSRFDKDKAHRPGEYAELKLTYGTARTRGVDARCWVHPALLIVNEETYGAGEAPDGMIRPHRQTFTRRMIMPLVDAENYAASTEATHYLAQPRDVFRGTRLVVECDAPLFVDVVGFYIGHDCQFAGPGAVSAAILTPELSPTVTQDTCPPVQRFTVQVVNRSLDPIKARVLVEGIRLVP
jgi:hypothetical protein